MNSAMRTRLDIQRKYMPRKSFSNDLYYPAELGHLEKKQILYRQRKMIGSCNFCGSPIEYQVFSEKKVQFFDHCIVCGITDNF